MDFNQDNQNKEENSEPQYTYHTYDEFQQSKSGKGKRTLIVVCSAIVAVLVFGAGVMTAGFLTSGQYMNEQSAQTAEIPADSTKIEITDAEKPAITTPAAATDGEGLTGAAIYAKVSPSTVGILSESLAGSGSTGSGIIMSEDGYIITNNHVVEGGDKITVVLYNGLKFQAEIIGTDAKTDLAVIKINADTKLAPAEFGNSDHLVVGDRAYAIGSPGGIELQNSFTGGFISAINRDITIDDRVMTLIQTDASINPGNSGGPLINKYGQVIGVNTIKIGISYYEGLGFAIPINSAKNIIDELIAYGMVKGRPAIGISGRNISEQAAQYNDLPQGLLVDSVDTRSDAYKQGVKRSDIIIGINGKQTKSMSEINKIKEQFKAGDSITLTIYRAGRKINIKIKLLDEADLAVTQQTITPQEESDGRYYFQIP